METFSNPPTDLAVGVGVNGRFHASLAPPPQARQRGRRIYIHTYVFDFRQRIYIYLFYTYIITCMNIEKDTGERLQIDMTTDSCSGMEARWLDLLEQGDEIARSGLFQGASGWSHTSVATVCWSHDFGDGRGALRDGFKIFKTTWSHSDFVSIFLTTPIDTEGVARDLQELSDYRRMERFRNVLQEHIMNDAHRYAFHRGLALAPKNSSLPLHGHYPCFNVPPRLESTPPA